MSSFPLTFPIDIHTSLVENMHLNSNRGVPVMVNPSPVEAEVFHWLLKGDSVRSEDVSSPARRALRKLLVFKFQPL